MHVLCASRLTTRWQASGYCLPPAVRCGVAQPEDAPVAHSLVGRPGPWTAGGKLLSVIDSKPSLWQGSEATTPWSRGAGTCSSGVAYVCPAMSMPNHCLTSSTTIYTTAKYKKGFLTSLANADGGRGATHAQRSRAHAYA